MLHRNVITAAVLLLAALFLPACSGEGFEITISEQRLQQAVEAQFPIERSIGPLSAGLVNPRVNLGDGRILFDADAKVNALIQEFTGSAGISTDIRYDPDTASFYLTDPAVETVTIQDAPVEGLNAIQSGPVADLVKERLNNIAVYKLDSGDAAQSAASLVLKNVAFSDDGLVITLGF